MRKTEFGQQLLSAAIAIVVLGAPVGVLAQTAAKPPVPTPPVVTTPPVTVPPPAVVPTVPPVAIPQLTPEQVQMLNAWLADAPGQGLVRETSTIVAPSALTDAALVNAVLDRARAMHSGRLAPDDFLSVWALRPVAYDPVPGFVEAVTKNRLSAWIATLTPQYSGYDFLRRGLSAYRAIEAAGGWSTLPMGPVLAIGAKGPRVTALRARLVAEDRNVTAAGDTFDAGLRDAVQRAQRRYGLNPTGAADMATQTALNVPIANRIGAIMANMERWRWLPRDLPTHRIQVNIAAAVLTVFEGDQPVASMRAVTGRPGDETPMLESRIHSLVVNPPWNVPTSIANRELWPAEKKSPGYLAARGFRIIETPEGGKRLQQASGPQSALGRIKFDFANPFSVYLHDTPSRAKFASYSRLASHGCVRLEKPVELAELVLKGDPKWAGGVQAAIDAGETVRVPLPEQVSVYLLYWTAFASANGQVNFRDDPYGWDRVLAAKIEAASLRRAPVTTAMLTPSRKD